MPYFFLFALSVAGIVFIWKSRWGYSESARAGYELVLSPVPTLHSKKSMGNRTSARRSPAHLRVENYNEVENKQCCCAGTIHTTWTIAILPLGRFERTPPEIQEAMRAPATTIIAIVFPKISVRLLNGFIIPAYSRAPRHSRHPIVEKIFFNMTSCQHQRND